MASKPVALLLADLGVTKTHSRPHVSNDNPFSEVQFKTLKYRPAFPERFGSIQDARAHCHVFFSWYNAEHHHSGLGLLNARRRASWFGRGTCRCAGGCARLGLCPTSGTISLRRSLSASTSSGSVDQPTPDPSGGGTSRTRDHPRRRA